MPDDNIFYILDVTKFDEGTYTCTAKNDAGSISANLNLTVLRKYWNFDLRIIELKFNNKTLYYTTYNNRTEKE